MESKTVTIILRIVGVLTILIGLILMTITFFQLIGMKSTMSGMSGLPGGMNVKISGAASRVGFWGMLAHLSISAWGVILLILSRPLGWMISDVKTEKDFRDEEF